MTPRIYVACLASYNAGTLHGCWIQDLHRLDASDVRECIGNMLRASLEDGAGEWAIHDYDGFGTYRVGEYSDLGELCEVAAVIQAHGLALAEVALDHVPPAQADAWIEDHYLGAYDSERHWAEEYVEDTDLLAGLPPELAAYFDYDSWARDAQVGGSVFVASQGASHPGPRVLVFSA